jgi:hypothetical protein
MAVIGAVAATGGRVAGFWGGDTSLPMTLAGGVGLGAAAGWFLEQDKKPMAQWLNQTRASQYLAGQGQGVGVLPSRDHTTWNDAGPLVLPQAQDRLTKQYIFARLRDRSNNLGETNDYYRMRDLYGHSLYSTPHVTGPGYGYHL